MYRRWAGNGRRQNRYIPYDDKPIVQYEEKSLTDDDDEYSNGVVVYENEQDEVRAGIVQKRLFTDRQCQKMEEQIELMIEKADREEYKKNTVDRAPLRVKYFFGEGYTYGDQLERKGPGMERLYPKMGPDAVDPVPEWIKKLVIAPCFEAGLIPSMDWVNSAVINDYFPGGCIVSHIDPIQLFDRPIISVNLLSDSALCFGCKFSFKPIQVTRPVLRIPMKRGMVTSLSGYAANGITHCVRPEDVVSRRQVIIIRRVLPDAPRLPGPTVEPFQSLRITIQVKPTKADDDEDSDDSRDSTEVTSNGAKGDRTSIERSRKRTHGRDSEIKNIKVPSSSHSSSSVPHRTPKKHPRIYY